MRERDTKTGSKPGSPFMTLTSPVMPEDITQVANVMPSLGRMMNAIKLARHKEIEGAASPEQVLQIVDDLKAADRIYSELIWMIKNG